MLVKKNENRGKRRTHTDVRVRKRENATVYNPKKPVAKIVHCGDSISSVLDVAHLPKYMIAVSVCVSTK